jgi:hypothetical protein
MKDQHPIGTDLSSLSDAQLLEYARAEIRSHAADIAKIVKLKTSTVEHGLYGYRWPAKSLGAGALSDVLMEASIILQSVRLGMSLEAAAGGMTLARGTRDMARRCRV